jgi:hypothetical protein
MTRSGWLEHRGEGLWTAAPNRALARPMRDRTTAALANAAPSRMPSGINSLDLDNEDHVAVFVLVGGDEQYYDLLLDYLAAGIWNPLQEEHTTLELTRGRDPIDARIRLEQRLGNELPATVDIVPWERNAADYEPETFTRDGMWKAIDQEEVRLRDAPTATLRVASEDCSAFMSWLRNPADYIAYEYELQQDLRARLKGHPFVQLCTFKSQTLRALADKHLLDYNSALLELASSHNRVLLLDPSGLHGGKVALRRLLREAWPPRTSRAAHLWARLLVKTLRPNARGDFTERRPQLPPS